MLPKRVRIANRGLAMRKLQVLIFANLALLFAACGGRTASDTAATSSPGNGESSSTGGRSYIPAPAAGGNSQSQGGRTTGGIVSVGGVTATGGYVGNGGAGVGGTSSVPVVPCGLSDADNCTAANNATCGSVVDTCGVSHDCGTCQPGYTCGAVTPLQCSVTCTPMTACDSSHLCGYQSDGCGGLLTCGPNANGACSNGTDTCIAGVCTA